MNEPFRFDTRTSDRWSQLPLLLFWLCGWAFGEYVVLGALLHFDGIKVVDSGNPAFMVVWLCGWTYGGITALAKLVEHLTTSARVGVEVDALWVERSVLGLPLKRTFPRAGVVGVRPAADGTVVARLEGGREQPLFKAADAEVAAEAAEKLSWALDLPRGQPAPQVPASFEAVELPDGHLMLSLSSRRQLTWAVLGWLVTAGCALYAARAVDEKVTTAVVGMLISGALATRWTWRRSRWLLQPGLAVEEISWWGKVSRVDRLEEPSVRVTESTDSDSASHWRVELTNEVRSMWVGPAIRTADDAQQLAQVLRAALGERPAKTA